jgi:hypothetical protein
MQNQQVRRNSNIGEDEERRRGIKMDLDEIVQFSSGNGVYDHGFDPPHQKDSGRGTGSMPGG